MNRSEAKRQRQMERLLASEKPTLEFPLPSPAHLYATGAVILTEVGVSQQHVEALHQAGQSIPAPVRCRLLIDTGASHSLVRHEIAERAGLKLMNANRPVHGIGVDTTGRVYLGSIRFGFPSKVSSGKSHQLWVNAQIASSSLPVDGMDGLIGRDVLQYFDLIYHGTQGKFVLKYLGPRV